MEDSAKLVPLLSGNCNKVFLNLKSLRFSQRKKKDWIFVKRRKLDFGKLVDFRGFIVTLMNKFLIQVLFFSPLLVHGPATE